MIKDLILRIEHEKLKHEMKNKRVSRVYLGRHEINMLDDSLKSSGMLTYRGPNVDRTEISGLRVFAVDATNHFYVT